MDDEEDMEQTRYCAGDDIKEFQRDVAHLQTKVSRIGRDQRELTRSVGVLGRDSTTLLQRHRSQMDARLRKMFREQTRMAEGLWGTRGCAWGGARTRVKTEDDDDEWLP